MYPMPLDASWIPYLVAGLLVGTLLVVWWGKVHALEGGWRWGGWRTPWLALSWAGLLGTIWVSWLRFLLQQNWFAPVTPQLSGFRGVVTCLLILFVLPVTEELFFRGAVFASLQRSWRPVWAVLLSATLSVICLPMQIWLGFVFISSVGYALAFRASGSLLASIGAHMLVALIILIGRYNPAMVGKLPARGLILCAVIFLFLISIGSIHGSQDNRK